MPLVEMQGRWAARVFAGKSGRNFTWLHTTSLEDKEPDDTLFRSFDFNLLGLSFLPPKKKMLEVIESDRKRNSKR